MRPVILAIITASLSITHAFGWGEPHHAITRAAMEVLPDWQKQTLGDELKMLGDNYCLIPDNVFTDKENAKFARMESQPGEVYRNQMSLPNPPHVGGPSVPALQLL